jgi:glycosyltransferase involved in cell wall biosynthesis
VKDSYAKSLACALEAYFHEWIKIYKKIDLYISPSQFLVDKFKEFGWQKPIAILPNPLLGEFSDYNRSDRLFDFKYILFFGRLSPEKGVGDLIRAYAQLDTGEKSKLVIAGDGPERIDLEKLIERQGLVGRVLLAGHKTGSEIKRVISEAEFIVVPSKWYENAPYSVIEAMAAGKTVICSDLGGLTEMVEAGVSGLLFKPGHIGELAKKMEVLLGNNNLKYMGEQAKKLVLEKHDPEKYYQKLMEMYHGVI